MVRQTPCNLSPAAVSYTLPVHRDAGHPAQDGQRLYALVGCRRRQLETSCMESASPLVKMFLVFIGENGLERSSMQGESHDISRSDPFLWQGCGEQFVDHLAPRGADASSSGGRWMRGDDDSCVRCGRGEMQIRAIKECPTSPRGADESEAFPVARRDGPAP